jgi:chromosome segregation ATPase
MIKKGLLGAALGAGALALVFGTAAPSYVRTAFHKVRHNAKAAVPVQFEIDRARQQIADLEPEIHSNIENLARAEVDVESLKREITTVQQNLDREKKEIVALRDSLTTGEFRLAGGASYTAGEVKSDLARRMDHYRQVERILKEKNETLKARENAVVAARKQLTEMAAQRRALLTKIDEIEARLKAYEATQAANEFTFDDSALSRAKQTVSELEKRLDGMARTVELEGRYAAQGVPVQVEPNRDVIKEVDDAFGTTTAPEKAGDKSL